MLSFILRLILAGVFIFSAISKLISIEHLDIIICDILGKNSFSIILSRGLVALEFVIGGMLILFSNKRLYSFTIAIVILLSIYLLTRFLILGIEEDCGCFGELLPMTTSVSILKNAGLILLLIFLFKLPKSKQLQVKSGYFKYGAIIIAILSLAITLFVAPPFYSQFITPEKQWSLSELKAGLHIEDDKLNEEKQLVLFLSPGCKVCKRAAKQVMMISKDDPNQDKYHVIFMTTDSLKVEQFFNESQTRFNYSLSEPVEFLNYSGKYLPSLYLLKNDSIINYWNGYNLNASELIQNLKF